MDSKLVIIKLNMESKNKATSLKATATPKPNGKKQVSFINFVREQGRQTLQIEVVPELEGLFKSDKTEVSEKYKNTENYGLIYYSLTDIVNQFELNFNKTDSHRHRVTLQKYGTNFYAGGYANFSILRTKGISKGIKVIVDDLVLDNEVKEWIQEFAVYIKYLYVNFVDKTEVKATINLEV